VATVAVLETTLTVETITLSPPEPVKPAEPSAGSGVGSHA
jgi:hypothetical protein